MTRDRIAAAIFAIVAIALLYYGLTRGMACSCSGMSVSMQLLGLAALQGVLAVGVVRQQAWARWLGIGVAFFWVLGTLFFVGGTVEAWVLAGLHAPLPLLLARPDGVHARTSLSLLLAGTALPMVLLLGIAGIGGFGAWSWPALGATAVVLVGAVGLARERTWGLLSIAAGGLAFLAIGLSGNLAVAEWISIPLIAAGLPFLKPIGRFLRAAD